MNSTVRLVDADADAGGVAVLNELVVGLVSGSGAQQSAQEYSLQQGRINNTACGVRIVVQLEFLIFGYGIKPNTIIQRALLSAGPE